MTVTSAFATYWLMPRLADFSRCHPDIEINLVVSDRYLDLDEEGIDVAVRYMPASLADPSWRRLLREQIFPVFGSKYKPRTALTSARDLLSERLLHLSGTYRAEARWAHWFQLQGLPVPEERSGIHVNTYHNMLQAAVEGQGIALAGPPLIDDLLASGTLIQMQSVRHLEREFYYAGNRSPQNVSALKFDEWLFSQIKGRSRYQLDDQSLPDSDPRRGG